MKFSTALVVAAAGTLAVAQPHRHHHRHPLKRDTKIISVPGPTVVVYEYEGKTISQADVCDGIENGTLKWASGTDGTNACKKDPPVAAPQPAAPAPVVSSPIAAVQAAVTSAPATAAAGDFIQAPTSSVATTTSSVIAASPSAVSSASAPQSSGSSDSSDGVSSGTGLDTPFPDGELDCSTFPEGYGAIPVPWQGIGGWSGIQYVTITGPSITHIDTAVASQGSDYCAARNGEIAMCSYACPPGYQKSQWPSTQGANAESIGGLMCGTDGKLHLTNSALSDKLCIPGVGNVDVKNTLSQNASICRTDYPGIEGETIPLETWPDNTFPLTVPDESTYYQHTNQPTSAQYYVNLAGVPVQHACNWSSDGTNIGNWAPVTIGAGQDVTGKTWLSIMTTQQNDPTNYKALGYTIELTGDFGGSKCFLTHDSSGTPWYCSRGDPKNYDTSDCETYTGGNVPGCTVQLMSGKATYVLS